MNLICALVQLLMESWWSLCTYLLEIEHHGRPSRVLVGYGLQNTLVCNEMIVKSGPERDSYISGSLTWNQKIERLWRDVIRCVAAMFYYMFYGILDLENPVHLFTLHNVFFSRANVALNEFMEAFNNLWLSTDTPNKIWYNRT